MHPKKNSGKKKVSEMSCAYHEAAHAVADVHFEFGSTMVTIVPNPNAGTLGDAYCIDGDHYDFVLTDQGQHELHVNVPRAKNVIIALLAGYAADIRYGTLKMQARQGASSDFNKARQIFRELGEKPALDAWIKRADEFVSQNWTAIKMIARELMETKTLDGTEVEAIMDIAEGKLEALEELARYRILAGRGPTSQFPFTIVSR